MAEKMNSEILRHAWGVFLSVLGVSLLLSALLLNPHTNLPLNPSKICSIFTLAYSHYLKVYFLFLRQNNKRNCIFANF